uniref:Uncharacterized protein n=1 Tax=Anguilla anguilla TaxID=7936 RepID=A0A0E9RUZ6_ANGAN
MIVSSLNKQKCLERNHKLRKQMYIFMAIDKILRHKTNAASTKHYTDLQK